ncbi:hypothetical protein SAMD00019534_036720 [Acytostelium subglobosum LB1]|uniref:hypothetical protein n=1 Tax=Acytostelium subglobosum LB1 TaxID=1410327 RepID=UPI000644D962|nr:hypothetical protein SAMD00019534_036720 [Acytostelium subglobosum LB1]GAM20497.1 hypothetical protein SAMD00019534_036720 [Acytostelium subglobosum LB1]|eukprot:XP_012760018.1 hypothetical protein SAMD00019534_036720 [Acytostelium subglobosum LB1]
MFKQIIIITIIIFGLVHVDLSYGAKTKKGWLLENDDFVKNIKVALDNYTFPTFVDQGPSFFEHVNRVINGLYTNGIGAALVSTRFATSIWRYVSTHEDPFVTGVVDVTGDYSNLLQSFVDPSSRLYSTNTSDPMRISPVPYQYVYTAALEFTSTLNAFNAAPTNPQNGINIRYAIDQFSALLQDMLAVGGEFRKKPLEQLPIFSLAATSHVLLLTDIARWGTRWGFSTQNITTYRTLYSDLVQDYAYHALGTVYGDAQDKIYQLGDFDGSGRFDNYQEYRRMFIPIVSDFVAMWYNLDPKIAQVRGFHAERVRFLFSNTIGYSIDPDIIESENVSDYLSPTYDRLQELWSGLEQEQYRGELATLFITHKDNEMIYSIQPVYTSSRPMTAASKREGVEVGASITDDSDSTLIKQIKFGPSSNTQNVSFHYDQLPRMISFSNGIGGISLDRRCRPADDFCNSFYGALGDRIRDSLSVPAHKVGTVFGWGVNERSTPVPALDAMTVGMLPSNVFANNVVLKSVTTVIDAQKYLSVNGSTFEVDADGPGLHTMFIPANGSITFRFESSHTANQAFDLYLRVSTGSKVANSLKMSKNGVDVATFALPFISRSAIVETSPDYDIILSPNVNNNLYTFTALGSHVRLTSIIFVPK